MSKPILANSGAIGTLAPPKTILKEEGFLYGNSTPYFQATSPPPSDNGDYAGEAYTTTDRLCSGLVRTITVWSQACHAIMFQSSSANNLSLIGSLTDFTLGRSGYKIPGMRFLKISEALILVLNKRLQLWKCKGSQLAEV
ncbi:hypothetical protein L916_07149 [Phytophthora nicotianae]|uniref:Uncharacterized protein n=1 Tax=Phytophthora nicotianae TaxID=4792 RepID=W2J8J6_PHYNI|nr:hypothetical protein L916_07149 [Phytophthora nicotianae]